MADTASQRQLATEHSFVHGHPSNLCSTRPFGSDRVASPPCGKDRIGPAPVLGHRYCVCQSHPIQSGRLVSASQQAHSPSFCSSVGLQVRQKAAIVRHVRCYNVVSVESPCQRTDSPVGKCDAGMGSIAVPHGICSCRTHELVLSTQTVVPPPVTSSHPQQQKIASPGVTHRESVRPEKEEPANEDGAISGAVTGKVPVLKNTAPVVTAALGLRTREVSVSHQAGPSGVQEAAKQLTGAEGLFGRITDREAAALEKESPTGIGSTLAGLSTHSPPQNRESVRCDVQEGDLVILGLEVVPDFRNHAAVVTQVHSSHCTVAVLDESRRIGVGECWPNMSDFTVESTAWRLGTQVVVGGLQGTKTRAFNGATGVIVAHPKQGHPCFVQKAAGAGGPDRPHLALCVCISAEDGGKAKHTLLEPRFLSTREAQFAEVTDSLKAVVATVSPPCSVVAPPTEHS